MDKASGLPARRAALAILSDVLRKRRALDVATADVLSRTKLDERDAAFARAIANETLRRFGLLDALIRKYVPKAPQPHKAGATLEILMAGACELLFLKVAPHAAVDAANRLAQEDNKAVHFKPLINAVLRRITREGDAALDGLDATRLSAPDWLWARWSSFYGDETARAIADAHLARPPLDLALKSAMNAGTAFPDADRLASDVLRLEAAGRIEMLPGYSEGEWWVQDFAAGLPAKLFGDIAGKRVIDLCAAPGGKTAQLAARGGIVTALDVSDERLALVRENLARLSLKAETIASDARDWQPESPAPFVLLDAPCTATGTIRRHPELPWLKSVADVLVLENLQRELFDAAAQMTAPGGTLVYAVCSLEPEEGIEQVESFLARNDSFSRARLTAADVPDPDFISPEGDLRTLPSHWPDRGGMDGFFAARLTRAL